MKKLITYILVSILISASLMVTTASAGPTGDTMVPMDEPAPFSDGSKFEPKPIDTGCKTNTDCLTGQICTSYGLCLNATDVLLPRPTKINDKEVKELKAVADLPEISDRAFFTTAIKTILGLSMVLTLVAVIVIAIYFVYAQGSDEDISKAKDILLYLIIGMAVMAGAYGVISGIAQFEYFKP